MAVVLQEAKCEATPLLERVLCSLHVVRPCDAVATEGVLFDATMKEMRFDYDKRERVNQWHAVGGVVRGIEVKVCVVVKVVEVDTSVAAELRDLKIRIRRK